MILFTILLLTLIVLAVFMVLSIGAGGVVFIILFGDVIVCDILLFFVLRRFLNRKK